MSLSGSRSIHGERRSLPITWVSVVSKGWYKSLKGTIFAALHCRFEYEDIRSIRSQLSKYRVVCDDTKFELNNRSLRRRQLATITHHQALIAFSVICKPQRFLFGTKLAFYRIEMETRQKRNRSQLSLAESSTVRKRGDGSTAHVDPATDLHNYVPCRYLV